MAIPSFFKQTKPRGFSYVPRYYDPQKEDWDQKRRVRSTEHRAQSTGQRAQSAEPIMEGGEKKLYRSKIMRGSMKNYFPRNRERVQKQSMIRFIVILIILAFVIYIYLRY
jgi:hypothetical protein